jgi:drug/metabolite transporter (DMT)-like permease
VYGVLRAVLYLVLCNLLWATNNVVGRAVSPYIDPFSLTAFRWLIAAPVYPLLFGPSVLGDLRVYVGVRSLILGLLGFTFFNFTLYWSLSRAPAYLVGFAYGFTPIIMIALSAMLGESQVSPPKIAGAILSTLGVMLLFTWRGLGLEGLGDLTGIIGGLAAGLLWSLYTVLQAKLYPRSNMASLTYASLLLSLPATIALSYPWLSKMDLSVITPSLALALLWIAVMPGVVAYYLWNKAVSIVGSSTAAPYSNLLPVFVAILGYITLGETLAIWDVLGGLLIVTGSTISMVTSSKSSGSR